MSGREDWVGRCRGRALVLVRCSCSLLLAINCGLTLLPSPSSAQDESSIAGVVVRMGLGPSARIGTAYGFGMELEAAPQSTLVPSLRVDAWSFGIDCIGFVPCPSSVSTYAVGGKYRVRSEGPLVPYVGADVGYMKWASDATGISLGLRAGGRVPVIRPLGLALEVGYSRFFELSEPKGRMLQDGILGFSAGLALWF